MCIFKTGCIQLRASDNITKNIRITSDLIREASSMGAHFIATPENTSLMAIDGSSKLDLSFDEEHDPSLLAFTALAKELNIWLLIGSLSIKVSGTKTANRSFLIDPKGQIGARYTKIHLFDVDLANGEKYRESNTVISGDKAILADTPWGKIGMTICYDIRFPHLYRTLSQNGAFLLTAPSAFTVPTGKAHWHVLLRARAIENGAFVVAPAQGGKHENGRETYGHSLIISPWGEILAEAGTDPCVIIAEIDPSAVNEVRAQVPSLLHDRPYSI